MKFPLKQLSVIMCWALAMYLAWLTGPWTGEEQTTELDMGTHDAMFHMHKPLHEGGKVAMQGQFHCELISSANGKQQLWISNAFRQEIDPAGFRGQLTIETLGGETQQVSLKQVGRTTELQSHSSPLQGQAWLTLSGRLGNVVEFSNLKIFWDYELERAGIRPPLGLDEMVPRAVANPLTPDKVALGHELFFDTQLSVDNSVSCATCHKPEFAFADHRPLAVGIQGCKGSRNTPTILNAVYFTSFGWSGAKASLEEQAALPLLNHVEMGNQNETDLVSRLNSIYAKRMEAAFGEPLSLRTITMAIACYERTLLSGDSAYDRFEAGMADAINLSAQRGRMLFFGKAGCGNCHVPPLFTDMDFHNLGIGASQDTDTGRFEVTGKEKDRGAFKTPVLRDIERTAPYMHDGSLTTLRSVVEFYNRGGNANPHLDTKIEPLDLDSDEVAALVEFLMTLNGSEVAQ